MIQNKELEPFYILIITFLLTIISKIGYNSLISLILKKNKSVIILYISSVLSSLVLNISSIIIGNLIRFFINIDIIQNFFLIIVFFLYGFMSLITSCQILSKNNDNEILIEQIINNSSDEDSERPHFNIKNNEKNEMEIELDNLNSDGNSEKNNNLNKSNYEKEKDNNNCFIIFYSLLLIEIGDKIQIMNISLEVKYKKWFYLILGNFIGNLIINPILILYGLKIIEKKINNIFIFFESIIYLIIAFYFIYLLF